MLILTIENTITITAIGLWATFKCIYIYVFDN